MPISANKRITDFLKHAVAIILTLVTYDLGWRFAPETMIQPLLLLGVQVVCAYALGVGPALIAGVFGLVMLLVFQDLNRLGVANLLALGSYALTSAVILLLSHNRETYMQQLQRLNAEMQTIIDRQTADLLARNQELQNLSHELVAIEAKERERLRKLLHDDAQQILIAGKLQAELLERGLQLESGSISQYLTDSIQALREVTRGLGAAWISEDVDLPTGVGLMLKDFRERFDIPISENYRGRPLDFCKVDLPKRVALIDLAREALLNVVKHAAGSAAKVEFDCSEGFVTVHIIDEGPGLVEGWQSAGTGQGIPAAGRRIEALGGRWSIGAGHAGKGVTVQATLPLQTPAAGEREN